MAFAMPLAAQGKAPRALLVRLVPGVLLCAGALLLAQPWRGPAPAPAPGALASAPVLEPVPIVGALLVVGGLLFFLPALLERLSPAGRGRGQIGIVEARALGRRKSLLLVEVDGRRLLIGASEHGFSTLAELPRRDGNFEGALARELASAAPRASPGPIG